VSGETLAIRARALRKVYRVYRHPADAMIEAVTRRRRHTERVALDGVDLALRRGEIVGVLGRNGAGKSTLLKVIAGTLERSSGELEVNGRITAILELGTGFHPEYTGRDNIYMGGLCLGMSRREIDSKLDSIIEFSELREFIDQPFKTYSTGMQARLTFSTAISVEPDILIVDEALSVGDERFQLKCFSRLHELRERKTTVLLVSHDTNTITTLCDRAITLENGAVYAEGDAKRISILYHNLLFGGRDGGPGRLEQEQTPGEPKSAPEMVASAQGSTDGTLSGASVSAEVTRKGTWVRYGTREAVLTDWGMFDVQGNRVSVIESGREFCFSMTLHCKENIADVSCGFAVKDRRGTVLWGITNVTDRRSPHAAKAGHKLTVLARSTMWLAAGDYFVTLGAAHLANGEKIDFIEDAIGFRVVGPGNIFTTSLVNLQTRFEIEQTEEPGVQAA